MSKVFNYSTLKTESAKLCKCPRCGKFGRITHEDYDCHVCNGHGEIWISESNWYRAKHSSIERSKLW